MVVRFYKKQFISQDNSGQAFPIYSAFPNIDQVLRDQLLEPVADEEVRKALFDMKSCKAPGPDGYQPYFYRSQWHVIGGSVCRFTRQIFEVTIDIAAINQSFLVLIPKVPHPEFPHQFRPIGLCNVNFKVLTKLTVHRLRYSTFLVANLHFNFLAYNWCLTKVSNILFRCLKCLFLVWLYTKIS